MEGKDIFYLAWWITMFLTPISLNAGLMFIGISIVIGASSIVEMLEK